MNEFNLLEAKVGDPIVVRRARYNSHVPVSIEHGTVTKVAHVYVTVDHRGEDIRYGHTTQFRKENGVEKDNGTNYHDRAYTPEQWATKQRRDEVEARIESVIRRHEHSWMRERTTEQLERIASILEESR